MNLPYKKKIINENLTFGGNIVGPEEHDSDIF